MGKWNMPTAPAYFEGHACYNLCPSNSLSSPTSTKGIPSFGKASPEL